MIADADKAGLLEEGVREILDETADLAPAIPDPANRQSVWSGETAANFAIELVTIMCRHPGKSFVVAVALTKVTAASGLGLTIALAVFAKKREVTLLNLLENYPACQAILREILAKILPEDK